MVKNTVAALAAGSISVPGQYSVKIEVLKNKTVLKNVDATGTVSEVQASMLRATAFSGSHGMTFHVWATKGLDSVEGCSILKISREGIR